jgi:hypothetical protein
MGPTLRPLDVVGICCFLLHCPEMERLRSYGFKARSLDVWPYIMASDFDLETIAADVNAICGTTGTAGEAFTFNSVTYYGLFSELNRDLFMDVVGFKDERLISLFFPRTALTPGLTVNGFIFRDFDSTTYQVVKQNSGIVGHDCRLRKPFSL